MSRQIDKEIADTYAKVKNTKEAARICGRGTPTVYKACEKYGITISSRKKLRGKNVDFHKKIVEAYREIGNTQKIMKQYHVGYETIQKACKMYGVEMKRRKRYYD